MTPILLAAAVASALFVPAAASAGPAGTAAAPISEVSDGVVLDVVPTPQQWTPAEEGPEALTFDRRGRVLVEDTTLRPAAELLASDIAQVSGTDLTVIDVRNARPRPGDVVVSRSDAGEVGDEGYVLEIDDHVRLAAPTAQGAVYGTRTLLQILLGRGEDRDTVPRGRIVDDPVYPHRGVMLDVARRFASIDFLKQYIRQLSWLKMNVLHLHLSDDEAFRLESDVPGLTSPEHYTKAEMADLVGYAERYGVTILPEIDVPSHSTRILEARPDLGHQCEILTSRPLGLLDLSNPDTLPFVTSLIDEYLPLFDGGFHFGTDEYPDATVRTPEANREMLLDCPEMAAAADALGYDDPGDIFRDFIDDVTGHIQSQGVEAWAWTWAEYVGTKPLETRPVLDDWVGTGLRENSAAGHRIVNSTGGYTYVMPGRRVLNPQWLHEVWQPWNWAPLAAGRSLDPDDETLLGVKVNLWNPPRWTPSIPEPAISAEFAPSLPVYAEKGWAGTGRSAYDTFAETVERVGHAPAFGLGALVTYRFEDSEFSTPGQNTAGGGRHGSIVGPAQAEGVNGSGLRFDGGNDRMHIGAPDVEGPWTLGLWVRREPGDAGQAVLLDSSRASVRLEQHSADGRVGITEYGGARPRHHAFDYQAPVGEWVHLGLVADSAGTTLYVDGEPVDRIAARVALPMEYLGSTDDAFTGVVDDVKVFDTALGAAGMRSLRDGLLMHYAFEESSGVTVTDGSGLGNDAGLERVTRVPGRFGGGAEFGGGDAMVYTAHRQGIADRWTAAMWLRRTDSGTVETLLSSAVTGYSIRIAQYRTGRIGLTHTGDPDRSDKPPVHDRWDQSFDYTLPADGTWRHLAFAGDGDGTTLYVDGVAVDMTTRMIEMPMQFIGVQDRGANSLSGTLDEVRLFDRTLSDDEIRDLAGARR